ncbi:hypothetical protein PSPO01_16291 [Paraphaeosphaeria sporulosa]
MYRIPDPYYLPSIERREDDGVHYPRQTQLSRKTRKNPPMVSGPDSIALSTDNIC